jgi:hypothetical protein
MRENEFLTPERLSGDLPDQMDVVVVGGGAAGCVITARISEETDEDHAPPLPATARTAAGLASCT